MDNQEVILRATSGTTANIAYECAFADRTKKTVTIGSYDTSDLPNDLATNIQSFNASVAGGSADDFANNFINSAGSHFEEITACTIIVKTTNVLIG